MITNYIKSTLASVAFVFIGATLVSCDNFLEVPPQGAITEEEIRSNPAAAQDLVTGVYNAMWQGNVHGHLFNGMTNIASDDADKGSTPTDGLPVMGPLDNLTDLTPSHAPLNTVWTGYYNAIAKANQALSFIPLSPADEAVRHRWEGEVRFLRAYYYFNLVRFFGGVPKIDRIPPLADINNPALQQKASKEEIYQLIISDLQFAMEHLPVKGAPETQAGRANKGAATGLLAKVYLYQQDTRQAYELTQKILSGEVGNYSLLPDYANIWRKIAGGGPNSVESLFEVQTGVSAACDAAIDNYAFSQGPRGAGAANLGWGFGTPSQALVDAYEADDKRKAATILFINRTGVNTLWDGYQFNGSQAAATAPDRYNYKAYHSRTAEPSCANVGRLPKNLIILRFGEILLIHAEAAFAQGRIDEALTDINRLRFRAGLPALTSITREAIWNERRVEMAMEHDRYFDIVRQEAVQPGRAVQAFAAHGKTWEKGKHEVFPIPQTQILLSQGQLVQNPNY